MSPEITLLLSDTRTTFGFSTEGLIIVLFNYKEHAVIIDKIYGYSVSIRHSQEVIIHLLIVRDAFSDDTVPTRLEMSQEYLPSMLDVAVLISSLETVTSSCSEYCKFPGGVLLRER